MSCLQEALAYGEAVSTLLGLDATPEAKAVAKWQCCADVVRNLSEYRPHPIPEEPLEVQALRRMDMGKLREMLSDPKHAELAFAFGQWRLSVAYWEANNAARLQLLASTLHTLLKLRELFEPEAVDKALAAVGDWVKRVWRVEVPIEGDVRAWATQKTFNHDVLPKAWRFL